MHQLKLPSCFSLFSLRGLHYDLSATHCADKMHWSSTCCFCLITGEQNRCLVALHSSVQYLVAYHYLTCHLHTLHSFRAAQLSLDISLLM